MSPWLSREADSATRDSRSEVISIADQEIPIPTLTDVAQDYIRSEITALWIHHRPTASKSESHRLLFAVAEMCPVEQPRSPALVTVAQERRKIPMMRRSLDDGRTLYAARVFTDDPMDAVKFYRGDGKGRRSLELATGPVSFDNGLDLIQEPSNEAPALIAENLYAQTSFGAVLPRRTTAMRVWSWLDPTGALQEQLSERDLRRIREFGLETLGIDFVRFPEHLGAIHLCGENPLLRYIRYRLNQDDTTLLVDFYERTGQTVDGCTFRLTDERVHGTGFFVERRVTSARGAFPLPSPPELLRIQLFDRGGALLHDGAASFIHHIDVDMGLVTTRRVVTMHDEKTGATETHTIHVAERQTIDIPSGERHITVPMAIRQAERDRALARMEETREFVYFPGGPGSRRKALSILRELLGYARHRCLICDPYFGARDVVQYAPFVETSGLVVQVLSSARYLRDSIVPGDPTAGSRGDELHKAIDNLMSQDTTLNIQCRVLPGSISPIHDRFLVIDDDVYMLGSSFNEFGRRATILFRLPDPKDVVADLESRWGDPRLSTSLDEWLQRRSNDGVGTET